MGLLSRCTTSASENTEISPARPKEGPLGFRRSSGFSLLTAINDGNKNLRAGARRQVLEIVYLDSRTTFVGNLDSRPSLVFNLDSL